MTGHLAGPNDSGYRRAGISRHRQNETERIGEKTDADAKKTALCMIPYGIYVLAAKTADGTIAAATVDWVTQPAFAFFKPTARGGETINGHGYTEGTSGAPLLDDAQASVECRVAEIVERGDHNVVLGEVIGTRVASAPAGRPDEAILETKDLGEKVFNGG